MHVWSTGSMALLWCNKDVCMNFQQAFSNSSEKQGGMLVRVNDWIEEKITPFQNCKHSFSYMDWNSNTYWSDQLDMSRRFETKRKIKKNARWWVLGLNKDENVDAMNWYRKHFLQVCSKEAENTEVRIRKVKLELSIWHLNRDLLCAVGFTSLFKFRMDETAACKL